MAQKRMFDKRITDSDKFMDLPNSSKALYFMAGMEADDRGFFQPRRLQKMCGFTDDDFKILIAKGYFISFESGVVVITDWNKNNYLDKRRITETEYVDELNLLKLVNEKYELTDTCLANAKPMLSQYSIEENSIEENSIEENSIDKSMREGRTTFKKPTIEEIENYCKERNNSVNAVSFFNFYEANGWVQGKNKPIRDWKACIRTWEQREQSNTYKSKANEREDRFRKIEEEFLREGGEYDEN